MRTARWIRRAVPLAVVSAAVAIAGCAARAPEGADVYAGAPLEGEAYNFALKDHTGQNVSLSDLRGQVVVLAFMDSRCREECPLTSAELLKAHEGMTADERRRVAFLGVNVNAQANAVADVAAATRQWNLAAISSWRFLTGSEEELRPIWRAYNISLVPAAGPEEELIHTPGIFLIDAEGQQRWYLSIPHDDPTWSGPRLSELLLFRVRELLEEG